MYIISNIYNLLWALLPHLGVLSTFMRAYEKSRRAAQVGMKQDDKQILGDLCDIYYHNRDLRLFLELLAVSSGVASALSVMALFDEVKKLEKSKVLPPCILPGLSENFANNNCSQKKDHQQGRDSI